MIYIQWNLFIIAQSKDVARFGVGRSTSTKQTLNKTNVLLFCEVLVFREREACFKKPRDFFLVKKSLEHLTRWSSKRFSKLNYVLYPAWHFSSADQ